MEAPDIQSTGSIEKELEELIDREQSVDDFPSGPTSFTEAHNFCSVSQLNVSS